MKPIKYVFVILTSLTLVFSSLFGVSGVAMAAGDTTPTPTVMKDSTIKINLTSITTPSIELKASVSGADNGKPTGSVTLYIDDKERLTKTLGTGETEVTFLVESLTPKNNKLSLSYNGDVNYIRSVADVPITIKSSSSTTVKSSLSNAPFGQWVKFTATVDVTDGVKPTGTVQFLNNGKDIGTATLSNSGEAELEISSLPAGTHLISARYSGDGKVSSSTSPAITQSIGQGNISVVLSSSNSNSIYSNEIIFTATVTGAGTNPKGTVTFRNGSATLGTSASTVGTGGIATLRISTLPIGSHNITATYSDGSANIIVPSNTIVQNVSSTNTSSTTLSSSNTNSSVGQNVTFTAYVSGSGGGTPTGSVTFKDGSTTLGTSNLSSSGYATLSTSNLSSGTHYITATYNGNSYYRTSTSSSLTQYVGGTNSNSWVSLSSSKSSASYGEWVTFTAKVSGYGNGTPSGRVTFMEGSTTLGYENLNSYGESTFNTSSLSYGTHYIKAVYQGNGYYSSSTSSEITQTIGTNRETSVSLTSSSQNANPGQWVTFTATVSGYGNGTPTGSVTLKDGNTHLSTTNLDSSGRATYTTSSLSNGSHSITAVYNGNSYYSTSSSSTLTQLVGNYQSTYTSLTQSMPSSNSEQLVTFTATVSRSGGLVTSGTVTFKDGSTTLGSVSVDGYGKATYNTGSLSVGSHSITAVYTGNSDYSSSTSSAATHTVYQGTGGNTSSCQFNDINAHWASSQICSAASSGLVKGVSNYQFNPDEPITRAEFITMLGRVMKASNNESTSIRVKDSDDIPSWAKSSINYALNKGIIKGSTDGNVYPNENITRGEMAVVVAKAMKWGIDYTVLTSFADDYYIPNWAKPFIAASVKNNVLRGRENNMFMSNADMTRAEATVVILQLNRLLN
ncbi:Ig-like domain repeat protein [Paenibacillus sp. N1-5-1-14]|uniref:Ig-like domain repeat protein n=1 Tax=Paenibacillus radicibacter TaxID=2972488 RepID=UPI002158EE27|nr:Ig-like domain repeat protein [Paenibacillus radicibacter]MCR8643863.1 Ig-like domain repeat protein [Paenibacillus radicibacter]